MKTNLLTLLAVFAFAEVSHGFDPVGPPPEKTMEWTTISLSRNIVPKVHIEGGSIEEAVAIIGIMEVPDRYKPVIDVSRIKDRNQKVKIVGEKLTRLEAIGLLAEQIHADVLISPGKVTLVPRADSK